MQVADATLGPLVWNVPRTNSFSSLTEKLQRKLYCKLHAKEIRMFYLGMLAADKEMSPEDKLGYYKWLLDANWAKFLEGVYLEANWKSKVDKLDDPIWATIASDYERLFRCFKSGSRPNEMGVMNF